MNRSPFTATSVDPPRPPTPAPPTGAFATQPLLTVGTITGLIAAGSELLVEFGLPLTAARENALEKFIVIVWPLAIVAWGYFKVWTPHSTQRAINQAAVAGSIGSEPPKV